MLLLSLRKIVEGADFKEKRLEFTSGQVRFEMPIGHPSETGLDVGNSNLEFMGEV